MFSRVVTGQIREIFRDTINSRYQSSLPNGARYQQKAKSFRARDFHYVHWTKGNWYDIFERFEKYEEQATLTLGAWSKLLEWIWSTLIEDHMSQLHGISQRLRSTRRHIPHARLSLVELYREHISYAERLCSNGKTLQERQQVVNQVLYKIFNNNLKTKVSIQMINNHVKEGGYWYEVLDSKDTKRFGYRLLLLLPVRGYKDIAGKTSNPVWTFLLQQFLYVPRRVLALAKALQPIEKAIVMQGSGSVDIPLLGYELRSPINLHDLTTEQFAACIKSQPHIRIVDVFKAIQKDGRPDCPDRFRDTLDKRQHHDRNSQDTPIIHEDTADNLSPHHDEDLNRQSAVVSIGESTLTIPSEVDPAVPIVQDEFNEATRIGVTINLEALPDEPIVFVNLEPEQVENPAPNIQPHSTEEAKSPPLLAIQVEQRVDKPPASLNKMGLANELVATAEISEESWNELVQELEQNEYDLMNEI
ncbi:hypothetical protein C7212DRAFT_347594 [Tuber magnatum]|uniref:Uncharacterized protein n=1 Tax=Tuber magnatum TaxID=42249 RepID=A0A317SFN3_9PEZI|nr:hypothetical protein C7212DRAFT_347594 [Tuber magnatum]